MAKRFGADLGKKPRIPHEVRLFNISTDGLSEWITTGLPWFAFTISIISWVELCAIMSQSNKIKSNGPASKIFFLISVVAEYVLTLCPKLSTSEHRRRFSPKFFWVAISIFPKAITPSFSAILSVARPDIHLSDAFKAPCCESSSHRGLMSAQRFMLSTLVISISTQILFCPAGSYLRYNLVGASCRAIWSVWPAISAEVTVSRQHRFAKVGLYRSTNESGDCGNWVIRCLRSTRYSLDGVTFHVWMVGVCKGSLDLISTGWGRSCICLATVSVRS